MLFGRDFGAQLMALEGDRGGKEIVLSNPQSVIQVDVPDQGVLWDIDTPAQIR